MYFELHYKDGMGGTLTYIYIYITHFHFHATIVIIVIHCFLVNPSHKQLRIATHLFATQMLFCSIYVCTWNRNVIGLLSLLHSLLNLNPTDEELDIRI